MAPRHAEIVERAAEDEQGPAIDLQAPHGMGPGIWSVRKSSVRLKYAVPPMRVSSELGLTGNRANIPGITIMGTH